MCETFETDEFYQKFLTSDDSKETTVISTSLAINEQIQKLNDGVDMLAKQLQTQVREQHKSLLLEAQNASKLSAAVDLVNHHMNQLEIGAERLKNKINTPYSLLSNQTRALARLHDVSHILRQSNRFLQLFHKLTPDSKDIAAQAIILFEIELLIENEQLNQIEFIRSERLAAANIKQLLTNTAHHDLLNALKSLIDEDKAVKSLQVFTNMQVLPKYIDDLLDIFIGDIKHAIKECFAGIQTKKVSERKSKAGNNVDQTKPKPSPGKPQGTTASQQFSRKFWTALESLFDEEIYNCWKQINFLTECLKKVVHQPNAMNLFESVDIEKNFHDRLNDLLRISFTNCPPYIRQCLVQDLPKLLRLTKQLHTKCENKLNIGGESLFGSLEAGYLEQCANNLKITLIAADTPNQDTIEAFIQAAEKELRNVSGDNRLCGMVTAIFIACNKEFWTKIEANIKIGGDAQQVFDVPNTVQLQNITNANIIYEQSLYVKRMIQNLGNDFLNSRSAQNIIESLDYGLKIVQKVVKQLIDSMKSAAGIILLSIHREPGLNNERTVSSAPSLYMKELQEFLFRAWDYQISPFKDKQLLEMHGKELAECCVELFVWNVAIIRPISSSGRQRLKSDCQHLENALNTLVGDLSAMSRTFRTLRSLSSLITLTPDELSKKSIEIDGPVSPFIVLLLLFGHAGSDLMSPHVAAGWSNEKITEWLSKHVSIKERLELVTGALQKYRNVVRQKNVIKYDPIYPIISNYLENVYKNL
ncbi:conserved oligomeric Golgi complex subunit 5 [Contarinia nasturtii]|uniref:conserved oligomeric Golgi complex subunit 5 n=1 Tax=Contarinia nasturtii TaxID=265458 RepID=UPI0012D47EBD|nr:conserved oligomeric Golgi complex subunit 5 [Contarinia nasturtii]